MRIFKTILIFFLVSLSLAHSQELAHINYTVFDGLPSSEVYCSIQDDEGYMWFGTDRGVVRFDGTNFEIFTTLNGLTDNVVFQIHKDPNGRIWFMGAINRLCYWDGYRFVHYKHNSKLQEIRQDFFLSLAIGVKDDIYIGTFGNGIIHIDSLGNLSQIDFHRNDEQQIIGKTFQDQFVYAYSYKTKEEVKYPNIPISYSIHFEGTQKTIYSNLNDFKSAANFRLSKGGYYAFDNTLKHIGSNKLLGKRSDKVISVKEYDELLIVGLRKGGVKISYNKGETFSNNYFSEKSVSSIYRDLEGGFWFTTLEDGIIYVPDISKKVFLNNSSIYRLYVDKDEKRLLASTSVKGVFEISDKEKQISDVYYNLKSYFYTNNPVKFDWVNIKVKDLIKGENLPKTNCFSLKNIKVAYYTSIFSFVDKNYVDSVYVNFRSSRLNMKHTIVDDSTAYIYSNSGLFRFKSKNFKNYNLTFPILKVVNITGVYEVNDSSLIIGTKNKGIGIISNDSIRFLTKDEGLESPTITDLKYWDEKLYLATNIGLYVMGTKAPFRIKKHPYINSLLHPEVYDLEVFDNKLFIATKNGVFSIDNDKGDFSWPIFDLVSLGNEGSLLDISNVKLPYDFKSLQLNFKAISFESNGNLNFRYRLNNGSWNQFSSHSINLSELAPNKYTFEAQVQHSNGEWSPKPLFLQFRVMPPFWQTWWFYLLIVFVLFLIGFVVYRYRVKKIKEKSALITQLKSTQYKALTSQMNPHFIFNALNSVQNFIVKNDKWKANKYLLTFSRLMRLNLQNSMELFVMIKDDLEALEEYLKIEQMRFDQSFEYEIDLDPEILELKIPNMLIQPYVENAIWHGFRQLKDRKGLIKIELEKSDNKIYCLIEDNGVGRDHSMSINKANRKEHKSHGMSITEQRIHLTNEMENIDENIKITDLKKGDIAIGTRVELWVKYTFD